jgi:methyl-accepting chemotaxis protein
MNSWFGNISVNMKLGLGFGLVLALTCVLALTGWTSLGGLIDRSNWMSDITQLNAGLTKLRVVRLQYMLTNGDETAAQNVQTTLESFAAQQQALISKFKSPENVKLLKQQAATIAEYQTSLNKMRNAYRTGNSARDTMSVNAQSAYNLIESISQRVQQLELSDQRFEQFQAVTAAKEAFILARYEVRGYTATSNAETEQKAVGQIDAAIASLKPLNAQFAATQQDALRQLETALSSYRSALMAYKNANTDAVQARKEMTDQGTTIVALSEQLYQIQLDRRDAESAQARTFQLISTLLALLVGVIAAVIITRQITRPLQETLAVVERIASGDLTQNVTVTRRDEWA